MAMQADSALAVKPTAGATSESSEGVAAHALTGDRLWYKDAVIYQLHVKAYCDSNDDGIGDFKGLISKLDFIKELGVNTIWLLPFYPSPLKDDGYDVADYHNIHPQYGTRADFRLMMREAHRRGLRVITELVMNHTSDQHPWFQAARRAPAGSSKRDFYVWSDSDQKYQGTRIIFTDTETSNWTWDPVAKAYYWHRFFSHQPDLNFDNPTVVKALTRTMRFWLDMGVDGFRLDAIPYLCEREGTNNENLRETHEVIRQLRKQLDMRYPDCLFLAEANQWPEDVREYFGQGDECHMAYHFPLMPRMYMAIAQETRHPIVEIMQQTPEIPDNCQWAIFLRNHDELTLEMVTSKERDYMYQMYAADPRARINLGIRRRLAPLLENDNDRIKLMNSLLLSMPGSPIIYYGDEIGMGDNIFLGDRNGVRTPMQWSPDRNAGFSRADPQRLYIPPIMDAVYGYEAVNVEAQLRDPHSLLNWQKRILAVRGTSHAFGRGSTVFLRPGNRKIIAYLREYEGESILCVANLARTAQPVELDLARFRGRVPVEMLGRTAFPPIGELPYLLTLAAYGFYWFRLATDVEIPSWHTEHMAREDLPVLVLFDGWLSFFRDRVVPWRMGMAERMRNQLEKDVLPDYVSRQRWYGAKPEPIKRVRIADHVLWQAHEQQWLVATFEVEATKVERYFIPLALAWDEEEERTKNLGPAIVAKTRQLAKVGLLADAFFDESYCRALVAAIGASTELATTHGKLRFRPTSAFARLSGEGIADLPFNRPHAQSSNTVVSFGERLFLKAYRRLQSHTNPELEIGRYLTEVAKFAHCVPLAGYIEHLGADGTATTIGLLQAYVENQGDGWSYAFDYLERFLEASNASGGDADADVHGAFVTLMHTLGVRTGELHSALALRSNDRAFSTETASAEDLQGWTRTVRDEAQLSLDLLVRSSAELPVQARDLAATVLTRRALVLQRIESLVAAGDGWRRCRYHGDYHLGNVLIHLNDFVLIDFEGEPARSIAERRRKHTPLRDVAGMLRSFNYAKSTALERGAEQTDIDPRLVVRADEWERQVREAFLRGYAEAVSGAELFPSFEAARTVIELFEYEKALYELRYELANRPSWAGIPLHGLIELLDRAGPSPAAG
jgi:maltose alpha-D-glucosyltransferase/alpha-amylase